MSRHSTLAAVLRHARDSPGRIAVVAGQEELTYAGLVRQAAGWAAAIRRTAAADDGMARSPEGPVAVLRGRDPGTVAAQLGVWLAGATCLPMDPDTPRGRVEAIVAAAGVSAVVTCPDLAGRVPAGVPVLLEPATGATEAPEMTTDPDAVAYLIFTSGSTGVPKGVMVGHRSLARMLAWHREKYGTGPRDTVSAFAGLGFDSSVKEIWSALYAGARLALPPVDVVRDLDVVRATLARHAVTQSFLTTALAEGLLAEPDAARTLRTLIVAGDQLRRWPPPDFPAAVFNEYGPTEATVVTTATEDLRRQVPTGLPPIGSPVDGVELMLVATDGTVITGEGVEGELWIGGGALALGYLGDPELTAGRFVRRAGSTWYRSGDVCLRRPDGQWQFVGRRGGMVKIRGYRIDPGEIEAALLDCPAVSAAAVVVAHGATGPVLVGFHCGTATETELRVRLADRLPPYMIPTRFQAVERLPLTSHGKIDRAALASRVDWTGGAARTPATATEHAVAAIWTETLGVAPGPQDDFFRLGGHSLDAAKVIAKVRARLGIPLAADSLYTHRELAAFSDLADHLRRNAGHELEGTP